MPDYMNKREHPQLRASSRVLVRDGQCEGLCLVMRLCC